jgi:hypothetical protein
MRLGRQLNGLKCQFKEQERSDKDLSEFAAPLKNAFSKPFKAHGVTTRTTLCNGKKLRFVSKNFTFTFSVRFSGQTELFS